MSVFLAILAAIVILFALNVLGVWLAFRIVRDSGLSEEEQAEVLREAAARLAAERTWFPW